MSEARSEHRWVSSDGWHWRVRRSERAATWIAEYSERENFNPLTRAFDTEDLAAEIARLRGLVPPGGEEEKGS